MKNLSVPHFASWVALAAFLAPACGAQSKLTGDWKGSLNMAGAELRMVLHIAANKDGALSATLDSWDQGEYAVPVTSISLSDSKLNLTVDAVHGTYTGTVNMDASEIDGAWSQGLPINLNFKRVPAAEAAALHAMKPAPHSDIDGTWTGALEAGAETMRILFKIVNTPDGLKAQLQSPDRGTMWIPATEVSRAGSSLTIQVRGIGAFFEGIIADRFDSIDGRFTQMGKPMPLVLHRAKE